MNDLSFDMADMLLADIDEHVTYLKKLTEPTPSAIEAHKPKTDNTKVQACRFHH